VDREAQLQWEKQWARPAAVAAMLAVLLQFVSFVLQATAFADRPDGDRGVLIALDENAAQTVAAAAGQALSVALIVAVLFYLLRATTHRRDVPAGMVGILAISPVLTAVGLIWSQLDIIDIAHGFTDSGGQTGKGAEERAEDLVEDREQAAVFLALAGAIALAFSYIIVSLNAMRAGLLSRFMGILGVIVGVLIVIPLLPGVPSIMQIFWLGAVAVLALDRWPGGRGPAWETGRDDPWPTAAERQGAPRPEEDAALEAAEPEPQARRSSRKRKRKKRR
jgi:hypothetical protein